MSEQMPQGLKPIGWIAVACIIAWAFFVLVVMA